MRRTVVVVFAVLALGALIGGLGSVAGWAGAAPRPLQRAMILCPLRSGPAIINCCGPIVATQLADGSGSNGATGTSGTTGPTGITGPTPCCYTCCGAQPAVCCCCGVHPTPQAAAPIFCCPPNALCARPLPTISSSPNPSAEGAPVTVSGIVSTGATGGTGVTGVTLWQELPGQRKYSSVADTTAKADGSYSFSIAAGTATTNRSWYVTNGSSRSLTDQQLVRAKVTATDAVGGGQVTLRGAVTPSHTGGQVLIEREAGTRWTIVGRAPISRGSRYVAHIRLRGSGAATLRVKLPASRLNAQSFSANLTLAHA